MDPHAMTVATTGWRAIAGNQAAFDNAAELLAGGAATAFAGAGASAGLYPLWSRAIGELIELAVQDLGGNRGKAKRRYWRKRAAGKPEQVAQEIRGAIGEGRFAEWVERTFGREVGRDGKPHTAVQESLARLPFAGYVTTNYDPGLEEALRRQGRSPRVFTWRDTANVVRWNLNGRFDEGEDPLFHAHGRYDRPETIVLGVDGYRRVYDADAPPRQLFEKLWTQQSLLFVGFSFDDRRLDFYADLALTKTRAKTIEGPRHLAIMPLAEDEGDEAEDWRSSIRDEFHAEALFYAVRRSDDGDEDHRALLELLADLEEEVRRPRAREGIEKPRPSPPGDDAHARADWLDQVATEHQRLRDRFPGRPAELEVLEQAWVRLELSMAPEGERRLAGRETEVRDRQPLERFLALDRQEHPWVTGRWLVEGEPGAGKTTLLRRLAADLAEATKAGKSEVVPLLAPLARLVDPARPLLDFVAEEYGALGPALPRVLDAAGREGRLLLLLDGLDEVPPERRPRVEALLRTVGRDWPRATVVVSSRPLGRGAPLPRFLTLRLQPLGETERRAFLEKWFEPRCGGAAAAEVERACRHFDRERPLCELSHNPLHLTLLAALWELGEAESPGDPGRRVPTRRSALFTAILDMLLAGEHREASQQDRFQPIAATREALAAIANAWTEEDRWDEPRDRLAGRLLDDALDGPRAKIEKVWGRRHRDFFDAVYDHTHVLGPHDGPRAGWRFWHRTFREALTAEHLLATYGGDERQEALIARFAGVDEDLGRWAEPLALLAGKLPHPDRLVERLTAANRQLGLRALATTEGLKPETLRSLLGLTADVEERREVYLAVPDQLGEPKACLAVCEQLLTGRRNGNDLFFLDWIANDVGRRWPDQTAAANDLKARLYEHIPVTDEVRLLFAGFETVAGERKPLWCQVPAGQSWIGSEDEEEGYSDERPRHEVKLIAPFWLAAVPVTRAQYRAFDSEKAFPAVKGIAEEELALCPAVDVTWYEAVAFCRWLAARLGLKGARLPREEEWEYACRAGTTTRYSSGNGEGDLAAVGWYTGNSGRRTHRVAEKRANAWGLYDIHGNVWELTASEWNRAKYESRRGPEPFPIDPRKELTDLAASRGRGCVARGGSYLSEAVNARSAYRLLRRRETKSGVVNLGFRVLLPLPPEPAARETEPRAGPPPAVRAAHPLHTLRSGRRCMAERPEAPSSLTPAVR